MKVSADAGHRPPALAVAALDRDEPLVARRVAPPDADGAPVAIGDEGEAERRQRRLRPGRRDRLAAEVEARLVGGLARRVLDQEPRRERDARAPHLVQRSRRGARLQVELEGVGLRRIRGPRELRDPEPDLARRDDPVQTLRCVQELRHLRQVAERDVVGVLRVPEGPAERVRVVRPHVEPDLRLAGPVRLLALRDAEQLPHEDERRHRVEPLRPVRERIERAGDDEVAAVDAVRRGGDRVHHRAVRGRPYGIEIEAEVRLVPDLEDVLRRRPVAAVVVERERVRELPQGRDLRRASAGTLGRHRVRPGRRVDDVEDRGQPGALRRLDGPVERAPVVVGRGGVGSVEVRRQGGRRELSPPDHQTHVRRARVSRDGEGLRLLSPVREEVGIHDRGAQRVRAVRREDAVRLQRPVAPVLPMVIARRGCGRARQRDDRDEGGEAKQAATSPSRTGCSGASGSAA